MARIRTVKPGYHKHKKVRQVGRDARLLNIGLWNLADDEGRLQDLPNSIIGDVFPTDDDVTPVVLREWCRELEEAGLIVRYQVDGEDYIQYIAGPLVVLGFNPARGDDPATGGHTDIPDRVAHRVWALPLADREIRL